MSIAVICDLPHQVSARFGRDFRLLKQEQFQRVFENPYKVGGGALVLLARSKNSGSPRLGLAVSRRSIKSAVARNRIKRVVRESFRTNRTRLRSLDVVVIARKLAQNQTKRQLFSALERHWLELLRWERS